MLFNSHAFIFLFLPIALIGYFLLGRFSNLFPVVWLALASLAFYPSATGSSWRSCSPRSPSTTSSACC
jgi:hypothetical protein